MCLFVCAREGVFETITENYLIFIKTTLGRAEQSRGWIRDDDDDVYVVYVPRVCPDLRFIIETENKFRS
jgi:hypothetical protein